MVCRSRLAGTGRMSLPSPESLWDEHIPHQERSET